MLAHTKKHLALAAAVLMTAAAGTGCSAKKSGADPTGGAKVAVDLSGAAVSADIQSIRLTISDNGVAPAFSPITALLTRAATGSVWTAYVSQISAGARLFKAEAFSGTAASGTKLFEGDTVATITAGGSASVNIMLQELNVPPGPTNYAPAITSLTASASYVLPGQTGTFLAGAADPDGNGFDATHPLLFDWSSSCTAGALTFGTPVNTFTAPNSHLSQITWTAPSVNSTCTVALRVSENSAAIANPLSVTTYFTLTVNANFGDAAVVAVSNSFPIITVRGNFRYNYFSDVTTVPVGQQGDLFYTAVDPDGDNVRFSLSAKCGPDLTTAAGSANVSNTYFSEVEHLSTVAPGFSWTPTFSHPSPVAAYTNPADDCIFRVEVQDLCTNGNCRGTLADGALKVSTINGVSVASITTGVINATHPARALRAPSIVRAVASNQDGGLVPNAQTWDPKRYAVVQPNGTYNFQAEAYDTYEAGPLNASLSCNTGTGSITATTTPNGVQSLKADAAWQAPAALLATMRCELTFTSAASGLSTVVTYLFAGTDPCIGQPDGTACDDHNACTSGTTCQAGLCGSPTSTVTCSASDTCHVAGVCDPNTGVCSNPNAANNTPCDFDANGCTVGDSCQSGVCTVGAAPVACPNPVPNTYCYAAGASPASICLSTGASSYTCNWAVQSGQTCTAADAATKCAGANTFAGFACDATGACVGSGSVACANTTCASGNTCQAASGSCGGGSNQPVTTACDDLNPCTGTAGSPDHCDGTGSCVAGPALCAVGQACNAGTCIDSAVAPTAAHNVPVTPPGGLAMDTAGNSYVAASMTSLVAVPLSATVSIVSAGGVDGVVARYDPTGAVQWAVTISGNSDATSPTDQTATFAAATQNGRVAIVGKSAGSVSFGSSTISGANPTPYVGALNATNGAKLWASAYDLGANGLFQAVASNPNHASNRIVVCGLADAAATSLLSQAPASPGGYGGALDAVIAAFDSNGTKLWAWQLGGAGNETCSAVAIDDNGDVVATGQFDGATLDLPGAGGTTAFSLTGPSTTARKFMWVARFNGATGVTTQAVAYSGTLGNAVPRAVAVAPSGDLVVGGSFSGNLTIGAALTSAGSEDAFVARLDGVTFAPVWNAVRFGGTAADLVRGVGVTSFGDIVAIGSFAVSSAAFRTANGGMDTNGAVSLLSAGAADIFVAKFNGATGATHNAQAYGATGTQNGDQIAVNRFGTNQVALTGTFGGSLTFGGAGTITAAGTQDVALVVGNLQ